MCGLFKVCGMRGDLKVGLGEVKDVVCFVLLLVWYCFEKWKRLFCDGFLICWEYLRLVNLWCVGVGDDYGFVGFDDLGWLSYLVGIGVGVGYDVEVGDYDFGY